MSERKFNPEKHLCYGCSHHRVCEVRNFINKNHYAMNIEINFCDYYKTGEK